MASKKRKEGTSYEAVVGSGVVDFQSILEDEGKELILFRVPSKFPIIAMNGTKVSFKNVEQETVGALHLDAGDGQIQRYEIRPSATSEYQTIYNFFPQSESTKLLRGKPFAGVYEIIEAPSVPVATEALNTTGAPRPYENLELHNNPIGYGTALYLPEATPTATKKSKKQGNNEQTAAASSSQESKQKKQKKDKDNKAPTAKGQPAMTTPQEAPISQTQSQNTPAKKKKKSKADA
eukprot:TRINITY_DN9856_c0_g1_i1.p1 TRINITY_DN9856_c0_g1~~TRINITY_DN9856_c0_g1_i1.p1  ORF type:complete len:235 (-),score=68.44 TRINITY_DN9856_c0_g1_i1:208-912(-)